MLRGREPYPAPGDGWAANLCSSPEQPFVYLLVSDKPVVPIKKVWRDSKPVYPPYTDPGCFLGGYFYSFYLDFILPMDRPS